MLQRAHDRRDFGVPEGAYRATGDVLAKVRQRFQVLRAASLSDDAAHGLHQPGAALAAGTALAAGLMVEKFHQAQCSPDHAGAFLHDRHTPGAKHRSGGRNRFKIHLDVKVVGSQKRRRRTARDEGLQGFVRAHAARMLVNQFPEGDAHRHFVIARALDVSADTEDARACAFGR